MIVILSLLPALIMAVAGCNSQSESSRPVLITSGDGTVLRARVYGAGATAVVLLHDFGADQRVWQSLAETLAARGFLVLTYDMRGHGESPGLKEVGFATNDATSVVGYLRRSAQRNNILLVGDGLGGTAMLKAATQEQVLGVIAISAHEAFRGLRVLEDIPRIVAPKLFLAPEGDQASAGAARALQEKALAPSDLKLVPGNLRGNQFWEGSQGKEARDAILDFLAKHKTA